jgi:hypothetical protein
MHLSSIAIEDRCITKGSMLIPTSFVLAALSLVLALRLARLRSGSAKSRRLATRSYRQAGWHDVWGFRS